MDEFGDVSGSTSEEESNHRGEYALNPGKPSHPLELTRCVLGYGSLCQPFVGREGGKGPDAVQHRVQKTTILHVYALRTRVSCFPYTNIHA